MSEKDRDAVFETASRRVVRRLMLMRWLAFLGRSSVPVCLAAAVAFILLRLFAVRRDVDLPSQTFTRHRPGRVGRARRSP